MKRILLVTGEDDLKSSRVRRNDDGSLGALLYGTVPLRAAFDRIGMVADVILGLDGNPNFRIEQPDLIVNLICDANTNQASLSQAAALIAKAGAPAINHPENVMRTSRESIAEMAADIPGLLAPHLVLIQPRRLKEIEELWRSGGVAADFLIRPLVGVSHGGTNLLRVATEADLAALEQFPFDGRAFAITAFVDYHSDGGLYRKYRLFFVDGVAYPRHLIMDENWMIHSNSRLSLMTNRPDLQAEERRFLANPKHVIGQPAWEALHELVRRTKLNFVGADFSLLPDGRALLFECNAAMNVLEQGGGVGFPYLLPVAAQIKQALANMAVKHM